MQGAGHGGLGSPQQSVGEPALQKKEVSSIAVVHDGRLLMGRRRDNGRWTLPGGHLNEGEHHADGARRELKEEAGIDSESLEHLGTEIVTTFTGKEYKIHAYKHEGKASVTVKNDPDQEVERWQWIDIADGKLPEHILGNLHSPKNVVLRKLGLLPKEDPKALPEAVHKKLEMLKSMSGIYSKFIINHRVESDKASNDESLAKKESILKSIQNLRERLTKAENNSPENTYAHLGHTFHEIEHRKTPSGHKAYRVTDPEGKQDIIFAKNPDEVGHHLNTEHQKKVWQKMVDLRTKVKKSDVTIEDVLAKAKGFMQTLREKNNPTRSSDEQKSGTWYHGSPSGELKGSHSGIHLGTKEAAKQALHARIGHPAKGEWDGTRKYGETKLAGQKTMREKGMSITGHNCSAPEHDYLPEDHPHGHPFYSDRKTRVDHDAKPEIAAYKLKGEMSNSYEHPHEDAKANGMMAGQIKRGAAKKGYYYRNDGEDAGSVSIVVPHHSHLEKLK